MGTGEFKVGGNPAMDWYPIQGGVEIFLVASCHGNRDKLRPDGLLASYADFTLPCHALSIVSLFYRLLPVRCLEKSRKFHRLKRPHFIPGLLMVRIDYYCHCVNGQIVCKFSLKLLFLLLLTLNLNFSYLDMCVGNIILKSRT